MKGNSVVIPKEYMNVSDEEAIRRINEKKARLGAQLVILAHHYQRREIVELSEFRGDSYGLSKKAAQQKAEFIAFCGVHFMAESADVLTREEQKVYLPNLAARCPMAAMAEAGEVETAWEALEAALGKDVVVPIVYVNSDAELKAFCGRHGGATCTSSNAAAVMEWGFGKREKLLFFPDEHLGRNTGKRLGIGREETVVWDPDLPAGGNSPEQLRRARLILWKGFCHVHTWFSVEHVQAVRKSFPGVKVIVHPECYEEVVDASDAAGSTEFIVNYVKAARPGEIIAIGTELNLVSRLASEHPDKRVIELSRSLCHNMFKVNLQNLLWTLDSLNDVNLVRVDASLRDDARVALERMLKISERKKLD
ncbi:MAG: quinolinate synthase NadA [Candidatus Eiseniibacteriota bacterium]|nr:MAG: quinolinate synthase NadA [Candidatus Eisenbacteria bacterium]